MAILNSSPSEYLKEKIRFLKKNPNLLLLLWMKNHLIGQMYQKLYDDQTFLKKRYKKAFNRELNIDNPITFNEKLQWMKLFYHDQKMSICADKYLVREYIKEKGLSEILNNVYRVYENVDDIEINKLPNKFVLKASHGSGWNIFCDNKQHFIWHQWKKVMNFWMHDNLYIYGREWVYKNMIPRIICEEYLEQNEDILLDYKFFCFQGKVTFIQVTINEKDNHMINLYDPNWNLMKEKYAFINSPRIIKKPACLIEMISIAELLSNPFPFARIDLYEIKEKVKFGEITFFPSSGFKHFEPASYDRYLGSLINCKK